MKLIIVILEFASPLITLFLTIFTFLKTSQVNKLKNQTLEAQENVERIEASIREVRKQISNNNHISKITELKEKTSHFQKIIYKYLQNPKKFNELGYSLESDNDEINLYVTYLREHNWLFEKEHENHADIFYNDLIPLLYTFTNGASGKDIHQQLLSIKPRLENFKSKISKMHNESMLT